MTKFAIATLGCKVNTFESCGYQNALLAKGYEEVSFKDEADIYIINTCAVTNVAAAKSRSKIHQAKAKNPSALIVVVGCYVQVGYEYLKEHEQIDILVGSEHKKDLVNYIEDALAGKKVDVKLSNVREASVFEALPINHFDHQTRAFLKIQDGCNQFCSYCIIPYARGKERSLTSDEVINYAKGLCEHHHKEIVLTGIHTGRYNDGNTNLLQLLKRLCNEVEGLQRIRLSSIEMNEISDEFIDFMASEPKLARHLHIPIQAGCDDILKKMNRPYTIEQFIQRVNYIRLHIPDISISTDIIVGFPSESDEQFAIGKNNLEKIGFSFLHVFPYSRKEGTSAALMKEQINGDVKKKRVGELVQLSNKLYNSYKQQFIGKKLNVLFEKKQDEYFVGHSSQYIEVYAKLSDNVINQFKEVSVKAIDDQKVIA